MPKMKSKSGAMKRFKATASGKIKRKSQNRRHILTKKNQDRKRRLRKDPLVADGDLKKVRLMILA